MKYVIDTSKQQPLNWSAKGQERIVQNVLNLINTFKYEVAYDRLLGLSPDLIDKPLIQVKGLLTAEIIEQVERFEPRATIGDVEISANGMGDIIIKVSIEI